MGKDRIIFYKLVRVCPGKRHGIYETNLGYPVRKELGIVDIELPKVEKAKAEGGE